VINASHLLEHLRDPLHIMKEIHRVLVDGGWAFIEVPSTDGRGAWQDPTHVSYWNENSFWYYTRQDKARYIRNTEIRFQEFKLETRWWDNQIAVVNAWLVALKQPRYRPHSVNI
jgi:SAM-dependent methyltransferase